MALKITSMNFVKESDVPTTIKNTELGGIVKFLLEKLNATPKGQALKFELSGAKNHTRFAIQRKLQKAGRKVSVSGTDGEFYISAAD